MIIGIWYRNAFLSYLSIEVSDFSKGIIDLMVTNHTLYTTPQEEIIYYTPGHPGIQYHRLHPQQGNTKKTTSYLSLTH